MYPVFYYFTFVLEPQGYEKTTPIDKVCFSVLALSGFIPNFIILMNRYFVSLLGSFI